MDVRLQRRLAAEILGCGENRIWIDPTQLDRVVNAITRQDVKALIKEGVIKARPIKGTSRVRARIRHEQRKKGRRRGHGKRKGEKTARQDPKEMWMNRIRKIRRFLRYLRDKGIIDRRTYRKLYMMAKGGYFRSLNHLKTYLREKGIAEVK